MNDGINPGGAPEGVAPAASTSKKGGGKGILWTIIIIIILAVIGYFVYANKDVGVDTVPENNETAAEVNGAAIGMSLYNARLEQARGAYTAQGGDLSQVGIEDQLKNQVLTQLINERLVYQAATKAGMSVESGAVDEQFNQIAARFGSAEEFRQEIEQGSFESEEAFRDDVRRQLLTQNYLDAFVANLNITVADEEVVAFYDELLAAQPEDAEVPPFEDVEEQLRNQLMQSRTAAAFQTHLNTLRADANIEVFIEGVSGVPSPSGV